MPESLRGLNALIRAGGFMASLRLIQPAETQLDEPG
jgi:hypothetical protein